MTTTCVNLLRVYGPTYRITWDPAYDPKGKHRDSLDPWYAQVPCRYGTIYPHGCTRLAIDVIGHPRVARLLGAVPGVVLYRDGDHEKTYLFDARLFDRVAGVVRPRRRRRLTPAQKAERAKRLAPFRFGNGNAAQASAKKRAQEQS